MTWNLSGTENYYSFWRSVFRDSFRTLKIQLLPNSLYRAACFENFEGIFGVFCSVNHLRGGGVMQISHNASHPPAIPTRRERESFEQNTSIKLKYFTLLPEATSMSREELSPELSVDSEDVENVASSFFA